MKTTNDRGLVSLTLCILCLLLIRSLVSLHSYSGESKSPMFGDYEAQRHWMEITYNLPVKHWYVNGTNNDLQYWGLDYPPLTAYHSYILGYISHHINSSWVELHTSRGIQSSAHKLFMRYSVHFVDLMLYIPGMLVYFLTDKSSLRGQQIFYSLLSLSYPGLILIDHGHFQYNCVSLGFTLWAVIAIAKQRDLLGAALFCCALNYKQMELYHALPFFGYLLGKSIHGKSNFFFKLFSLGVVVISMFALCWLPFLENSSLFLQVLNRLFPFGRGLYEDKVANVWCSLSIVIKLKNVFNHQTLIRICSIVTLLSTLPSTIQLICKPSVKKFKLALVNASLCFFLFSFQVHEKSILQVALPVCLLLHEHFFISVWFLLISIFSMIPLLLKDSLHFATLSTLLIFLALALFCYKRSTDMNTKMMRHSVCKWKIIMFFLSIMMSVCLVLGAVLISPPSHLPDLWAVLISTYSCAHFLVFMLIFHYYQLVQ